MYSGKTFYYSTTAQIFKQKNSTVIMGTETNLVEGVGDNPF